MADQWQLALLKRSVEEWNKWRKANPNVRVDLTGANLVGRVAHSLKLSNADLRGADLRGTKLQEADLSGTDLRNATFDGANILGGTDFYKANLSNADLSGTHLGNVNFGDANLSDANLSDACFGGERLSEKDKLKGIKPLGTIAYLRNANLRNANLRNADLSFVSFDGADLRNADLRGADLRNADLRGARLDGAKQGSLPPQSTTSEPHQSQSSSTTDWLSLVETVGVNLFVTAATLASIIQGLDVVERRWREHQEKHKQQSTQPSQPASASSPQPAASSSQKILASDKEIIEILLVMDDGSQHGFKRWVSDPDALKAYIDAFSDPTSTAKPRQVVFRKLGGRALVVDVTKEGKNNKQLNVILSYLDADPL